MAKSKNKKLTIEDALVPVEEQPYEVPGNWCWTYLNNIAQWGSGGTPSRKHPEYYGGSIPWIKTGELEDDYLYDSEERITEEAVANSSAKIFPENSVLIAMYGATIGKTAILAIPATTNQACACARCYDFINNKYLFYYLRSQKDAFIRKGKGGAQPNISQDIIKNHSVPLPPLAEQQRIVEQIESLFSKLDEAKDKAQRVLDSVEDRRLSILNAAYSGRLTTNWRNGAEASFKTMLLSEICTKITDGFHNSPKPVDEGYPYVMAGCVKEQGIDYYNGLYMDEKNHRELYNKAHPEKGDILMVNIGAGSGTAAIIDVDFEFSFKNSAILKLKKDIVNPYYVLYYLWLRKKYLLIEVTRGGAQPFLSLKIINNISIPICSLDEQYEIVKIVDSILQIENSIKDKQERVIETADIVKKSILAKAFRGELGTNNPDEECSLELLKRMIEE